MLHRGQVQVIGFMLILSFVGFGEVPRSDDKRAVELGSLSLEELMNIRVETASMRQQSLSDAPATSVVITRSEIQERGYVHLGEILRDLPSVDSYGNFSELFEAQFTIRGHAGNNRFVILKNGVRLNPVTSELISVDENYPLYGIKQVEIIYGPASALYGADAFAGIINLITDEELGQGSEVTITGGNAGTQLYSGMFGHSFEKSGIQFNVGGHFRSSRNPDLSKAYPNDVRIGPLLDPFSGDVIVGERFDSFSDETSSYSFDANASVKRDWTVGYNERRYNQLTGNGQRPEFNIYGPEVQFRMRTAHTKYSKQWSSQFSTESQLAYSVSELLPETGYNNYYTNYTRSYKYSRNRAAIVNQNFFYDLSGRHNLVAGVSYAAVRSRPETSDLASPLDPSREPEEQGFEYPIESGLPMQFFDIGYRNAGTFAQVQSQWSDGFSSTVGVRYDHDTRFGDTVNPRLGVVKRIGTKRRLKLLYGEAFRAPSTIEMYGHFGSFVDTDPATGKAHAYFFHVPNPSLEPEKLRMVELAYADVIGPHVAFQSSIYYSRASNLIVDDGEAPSPGEFAGGVVDHLQQNANRGRMTTYGGDARFNFKFQRGQYGIDPWVHYSNTGGVLYDNVVSGGRTELRYVTPHKVKGGVRVQRNRYSLVTRFRALGESTHARLDPTDPRKRLKVPGSLVFDLTMKHDLGFIKGAAFSFNVRNLFNAKYYTPGGPYDLNYLRSPQAPRTWNLQLSYSF